MPVHAVDNFKTSSYGISHQIWFEVEEFDNADDRVFEATNTEWDWWGDDDGSDKVLRDGENTMYIFHRQGRNTVLWDVFMWTDDPDYVPTDEDYQNATVFVRDKASAPSPGSGPTDVLQDVGLTWNPGQFAGTHDVYFRAAFENIDTADRASPPGVLVSQSQNVLATASGVHTVEMGPEKTIEGSGLSQNRADRRRAQRLLLGGRDDLDAAGLESADRQHDRQRLLGIAVTSHVAGVPATAVVSNIATIGFGRGTGPICRSMTPH